MLLADPSAIEIANGAIPRLGALAPISQLGPDSVRLSASPALADYSYALAMRRRGATMDGVIIVFERRADATEDQITHHSRAPVGEFNQMITQFDAVVGGYAGGDRLCTDGVDYAFERRRGQLTMSGTSVSTCDRTYEKAAGLLVEFTRRFAPLPKLLNY